MGRYRMTPEEADNHHSEYGNMTVQQSIDYERDMQRAAMNIEIFGSNTCSYCTKAKEFCEKYGYGYTYKNIDEDEEAFDQLVGRIKSWKTVPQIFVGAVHIGGYDELVRRYGDD